MGIIDAQGGPVPANIEALFPVWDDPDTWNLAAISPIVRSYPIGIGSFQYNQKRKVGAAWVQDDWRVTDRLTLNLGLRYDVALGVWANAMEIEPWLEPDRPDDYEQHRSAPRLRVLAEPADRDSRRLRLLLRRGAEQHLVVHAVVCQHRERRAVERRPARLRDQPVQRADADLRARRSGASARTRRAQPACGRAPTRSRRRRSSRTCRTATRPRSGCSASSARSMAVEVDYAYTGGTARAVRPGAQPGHELQPDLRPATGINYPFTNIARRADPNWGIVQMEIMERRSNYHGLQTGVHEADERSLAGLGHLYAVVAVRQRSAAAQRPAAGAPSRSRRTSAASTGWPPPISAIAPCSTASGTPVRASR